ncbi:MAG: ammonium transporter [Flavobacterium sp.]|jgi:Amt family ammonium transporter|uniref:ammonium transporter n=1 Tax=unclassified Flavobacterium TaxID=196869 RepID=UPI000C18BAD3|nr:MULTISPECIES: ammonium transporter [unclassified Flavobacterium]MDP3680263.1 ammonium transporter [Flavobacterium sp.]PIF62404.1 ammonium transporter [Flavobacterium sp. 11]RKS14667.1 ammonium transporter [Flavobacterium sp. 120]WKL43549.1 ammonium transporter [Flavobacterium sp. ZE23DGlu08]
MRKIILSVILITILVLTLCSNYFIIDSPAPTEAVKFDTGDTAWMIVATALVLIMTPGLGFFYGGMVGKKNVISTMLQSFMAMIIVTVLWVVVAFGLSFGPTIGGIIGNPLPNLFFQGVNTNTAWSLAPTIPFMLFALFQAKFAIITPALITGAFAERIRFWAYLLFMVLFILLVYAPLAHMTWHPDGVFFKMGVLDFAGGTVVHMSAGWAALAGAIFLGKRKIQKVNPARITYVLLGTGLLWFGWFGFNAGSALGSNGLAVQALGTTTVAAAAAGMAWVFLDKILGHKLSAMGACIGAVVGLVAITPAAGFVTIPHAMFIGIFASIVSNLVVSKFPKGKIDDALDVFACHGVGGMVGMLLTGVFASKTVNSVVGDNQGLIFGDATLFLNQLTALVIVSVFAFSASYFLFFIVNKITPLRVSEEKEELGLDISQHGEFL